VHARVASGEVPDTWLVVEHEPVITLGRNGKREHVLLAPEALAARGIDVVPVERGGDATYHGPGQLVVYPIVKLARFREVVPFVTSLESAVIATLATLGIKARAKKEHRGVYVGGDAICSIGLAVKQMTVMHGIALNVSTVLDYDRLITPCGTPEFGITSISRALEREITLDEARTVLLAEFERHFKVTFERQACDLRRVTCIV
jgi:lipoate-protein ligase B